MSRAEGKEERLDRELIEFLNELRVVLPGVQVLFAFLLTVPFTNRFEDVTNRQRQVFFATFLCTTAATALLIAPSAYHRLRWRQHDKEQLLRTANRLSIGGMVFLTLALVGAVYLVTDLLFHYAAAVVVTAAVGGFFVWFWWGLPLWRAAADDNSS
jgi:predicted membrane channel-forming protein YqfA (hemolysin III family)